jgi:hypothetical protein
MAPLHLFNQLPSDSFTTVLGVYAEVCELHLSTRQIIQRISSKLAAVVYHAEEKAFRRLFCESLACKKPESLAVAPVQNEHRLNQFRLRPDCLNLDGRGPAPS